MTDINVETNDQLMERRKRQIMIMYDIKDPEAADELIKSNQVPGSGPGIAPNGDKQTDHDQATGN